MQQNSNNVKRYLGLRGVRHRVLLLRRTHRRYHCLVVILNNVVELLLIPLGCRPHSDAKTLFAVKLWCIVSYCRFRLGVLLSVYCVPMLILKQMLYILMLDSIDNKAVHCSQEKTLKA